MPRLPSSPIEIARGLLLLGVFHVHALHWVIAMHADAAVDRWAWLQIKLMAGHVVLFFALAGLTSKDLGDKPAALVLRRSLMLVLLAALCHTAGVLIDHVVSKPWPSLYGLIKAIGKPIVYGAELTTFAWFFIVLAVVRVYAYLLLRNWRWFALAAAGAATAVTASLWFGLTDNLWGWRYWPAAFLLFLIGMRIPAHAQVPHRWGLPLAAVALVLPLVNQPWLLRGQWCVDCDLDALIGPALGDQGTSPLLYFLQALLAVPGLIWLSGVLASTPLARGLAYVGRHSLQLLVLHGWVSLLYGLAVFLPFVINAPGLLFPALFVANTALHLVLFHALKQALLDRVLAVCSIAARRVQTSITALS